MNFHHTMDVNFEYEYDLLQTETLAIAPTAGLRKRPQTLLATPTCSQFHQHFTSSFYANILLSKKI